MLFSKFFQYVLLMTRKYDIDESHGLSHSMNVLHYATMMYDEEVKQYPILKEQDRIIFGSAILHDTCDKKYMDEKDGIRHIKNFLNKETDFSPNEISTTCEIISTMSYSKVKKNGFPNLGGYQKAYNIVRESDLLTAYDFDRSIIYNMSKNKCTLIDAFENANDIFENRVFKHEEDGLLLLDYSKAESLRLQSQSLRRIEYWRNILNKNLL
jgi:HD superfamily phosphodiesterase